MRHDDLRTRPTHGIRSSTREEAVRRDPTSIFRGLQGTELSVDEIDAMRERVSGVLRARGVAGDQAQASRGSLVPPAGSRARATLGAVAAAAVLLAGGAGLVDRRHDEASAGPASGERPVVAEAALDSEDEALVEAFLAARPLVEGGNLAIGSQRVELQFASAEFDLAFVADAGLDL